MNCELRGCNFPTIICYCTHTAGTLLMDPVKADCKKIPSSSLAVLIHEKNLFRPSLIKARPPKKPKSLLTLSPPWRRAHDEYKRRFIGINTTPCNAPSNNNPAASVSTDPTKDPNAMSPLYPSPETPPFPRTIHHEDKVSKLDALFNELGLSSRDYLSVGNGDNIITISEFSDSDDDYPRSSSKSANHQPELLKRANQSGSREDKTNWKLQLGEVPQPTTMKELADFHQDLINTHGYGSAAYILRTAKPGK